MKIESKNRKRYVDVGSPDIMFSLYSTINVRLKNAEKRMPLAFDFFKVKKCLPEIAMETGRQFNLIRDELARIAPEKIVYDCTDIKKQPPWGNNISPVITSAANYYTTTDGKDLLYEIVSILVYGAIAEQEITISE